MFGGEGVLVPLFAVPSLCLYDQRVRHFRHEATEVSAVLSRTFSTFVVVGECHGCVSVEEVLDAPPFRVGVDENVGLRFFFLSVVFTIVASALLDSRECG